VNCEERWAASKLLLMMLSSAFRAKRYCTSTSHMSCHCATTREREERMTRRSSSSANDLAARAVDGKSLLSLRNLLCSDSMG
jgi:hypothetical protein